MLKNWDDKVKGSANTVLFSVPQAESVFVLTGETCRQIGEESFELS